jgi:hypothetical protein
MHIRVRMHALLLGLVREGPLPRARGTVLCTTPHTQCGPLELLLCLSDANTSLWHGLGVSGLVLSSCRSD